MFLLSICLASGFLIGVLGITYKLASKYQYDGDNFRAALTWIAALLALAATFLTGESLTNRMVLLIGPLCGFCFVLALVSVMRAMEIGAVSFTWILINLSIVIPIFASAILWSESIRTAQWLGVVLFALSLVLFGKDLSGGEQNPISPAWVLAAIVMFVANGTVLLLLKVLDKNTSAPHTFNTLFLLYVTAAILFALRRQRLALPRPGELRLGAVAALSMMGGQALIIRALSINTTSALPIIHGSSIIVVAAISALMFQEKFSIYSGSGLIAGITSIVMLTVG